MGHYLCLCCYGKLFGRAEETQLLVTQGSFAAQLVESLDASLTESKETMKDSKRNVLKKGLSRDIKLIWANNRQTNAVFSKLGAEDIVSRYDRLLHEWKLLKDGEQEFKGVMGLDHDCPLVKCLDFLPPDMRIGFCHGGIDGQYEFHLDVHPLVSVDKLKEPIADTLKTAIFLFRVISDQMNFVKMEGASIQRDLEKLTSRFKNEKETSVNIMGVRHSVELLNVQQVEQALLIVKDIIAYTVARSDALIEYIAQQGDKVDMQVSKVDPANPKVIIFSKKLDKLKKKKYRYHK